MVHITLPMQHSPSPLTAFAAGSFCPTARAFGHRIFGGTLSSKLHTPPLPVTRVRVGDERSCARSWRWTSRERAMHDKISKSLRPRFFFLKMRRMPLVDHLTLRYLVVSVALGVITEQLRYGDGRLDSRCTHL